MKYIIQKFQDKLKGNKNRLIIKVSQAIDTEDVKTVFEEMKQILETNFK